MMQMLTRAPVGLFKNSDSKWSYSVQPAFMLDNGSTEQEHLPSGYVFDSKAQACKDAIAHLMLVVERRGARMLVRPVCYQGELFYLMVADGDSRLSVAREPPPTQTALVPLPDGFDGELASLTQEEIDQVVGNAATQLRSG